MTPPSPASSQLDYAIVRRSDRCRWGIASLIRAAIVFGVIVYMFFTVYAWIPRNRLVICVAWPPAFVVTLFGIIYGFRGLRKDARPRWAMWGLVLNLIFGLLTFLGTCEACDELQRAFRVNHGIVISADR